MREIDIIEIRNGLSEIVAEMDDYGMELDRLRSRRDQLFIHAYDNRALTVTEMARIAGLRRESVHRVINLSKERNLR